MLYLPAFYTMQLVSANLFFYLFMFYLQLSKQYKFFSEHKVPLQCTQKNEGKVESFG